MSSRPLVRPKRTTASPLRRTPVSRREFIRDPAMETNPSSSIGIGGSKLNPDFKANKDNKPAVGGVAPTVNSNTGSSNSDSANANSNTKYTDFSLKACTIDEVKDKRHHVLKFHSRTAVDPAKQFTPPIRFHRKDPRNLQLQLTLSELEQRKQEEEASAAAANAASVATDEANANSNDASGAGPSIGPGTGPGANADLNKPQKPVADMSVVAPEGGARKPRMPFQRKTQQGYKGNEGSRTIRYEEQYPWIMEDFDGKNTWVGNYEAAQSDTYVLFVFDSDGFKMVPAEKWYKMTPRNKYLTLTLEEAEQKMEKKQQAPRWFMKKLGIEKTENGQAEHLNARRRFRTVEGSVDGGRTASSSSSSAASAFKGSASSRRDDDEIDFDEEFADDEEAPIMEGDEEDVKAVESKVKREQRGALFGQYDDSNELFEEEDNRKIDKEGKKLKKYLKSLEKNSYYDSDDEENPYVSEEDISGSDKEDDINIKKEKEHDSREMSPVKKKLAEAAAAAKLQQSLLNRRPKKEYKNLPKGLAILQLAPSKLKQFPSGIWNPNAKRLAVEVVEDSEPESKRIKVESASSASRSLSPVPSSGNHLLTEERVRNLLLSKRMKTDELLMILKPDLRKNPQNTELLKSILRKIAKLSKGFLILKDEQSQA